MKRRWEEEGWVGREEERTECFSRSSLLREADMIFLRMEEGASKCALRTLRLDWETSARATRTLAPPSSRVTLWMLSCPPSSPPRRSPVHGAARAWFLPLSEEESVVSRSLPSRPVLLSAPQKTLPPLSQMPCPIRRHLTRPQRASPAPAVPRREICPSQVVPPFRVRTKSSPPGAILKSCGSLGTESQYLVHRNSNNKQRTHENGRGNEEETSISPKNAASKRGKLMRLFSLRISRSSLVVPQTTSKASLFHSRFFSGGGSAWSKAAKKLGRWSGIVYCIHT